MPESLTSDHTLTAETANDPSIARHRDAAGDGLRQPLPEEGVDQEAEEREQRDQDQHQHSPTGATARHKGHEDTKTTKTFGSSCLCDFVLRASAVHHPLPLKLVKASGLSVSRCRNSAITSARPTAASAAATVITKNVMIWPSTVPR